MIALLVIVIGLYALARAVRGAATYKPRGDMGGSQQHKGFDGH